MLFSERAGASSASSFLVIGFPTSLNKLQTYAPISPRFCLGIFRARKCLFSQMYSPELLNARYCLKTSTVTPLRLLDNDLII